MVELRASDFTAIEATAIEAEGARVGFVSCRICGAAILFDPRDQRDYLTVHMLWHDDLPILLDRSGGSPE